MTARPIDARLRAAHDALNKIRVNKNAMFLFGEIVAGRNRIFYMDERPPGWPLLARLGLAERVKGTASAELTALGRLADDELTGRANRGTGRMDPYILKRQRDEVMYNRAPGFPRPKTAKPRVVRSIEELRALGLLKGK